MVDTGTGWYGYAEPTPAQPVWPEQYVVHQDPMAQQWAAMPAPEPQYEYPHGYGYGYPQQPQGYYYAEPQPHHPSYASYPEPQHRFHETEPLAAYEQEFQSLPEPEPEPEHEAVPEPEPLVVISGGRAAARAARCRTGRRRSVLLTIAVPTVAVLGIGAAAAGTLVPKAEGHTVAANDAGKKLTADDKKAQAEAAAQARASAEQVSRDQARQALTLRTAAAKKAAAEAPRYVMPITAHTGLSALYGQAGTHWMSLHTGIDFPVATGTEVHAVTDGTVSTKWNAYYGNMLILTAPDGTQTWYCHLSAYKKRSGTVKAGDVVAYSGDTGNSTGPHMHFEVHPHGGVAIDPLPWLLSHGLDPR